MGCRQEFLGKKGVRRKKKKRRSKNKGEKKRNEKEKKKTRNRIPRKIQLVQVIKNSDRRRKRSERIIRQKEAFWNTRIFLETLRRDREKRAEKGEKKSQYVIFRGKEVRRRMDGYEWINE